MNCRLLYGKVVVKAKEEKRLQLGNEESTAPVRTRGLFKYVFGFNLKFKLRRDVGERCVPRLPPHVDADNDDDHPRCSSSASATSRHDTYIG